MYSLGLAAIALAAAEAVDAAQQFSLVHNHQGSTLSVHNCPGCLSFLLSSPFCSLNDWVFQNGVDANNTGNVLFQTQEQAAQENLTFLNSAGNYVIKVDNTTSGANDPNFGRPSVKVLSNYTYDEGSLIIMDAVHIPFGVRLTSLCLANLQHANLHV